MMLTGNPATLFIIILEKPPPSRIAPASSICISASFLTGTVILLLIFIQKEFVSSIGNWIISFLFNISRPVSKNLMLR